MRLDPLRMAVAALALGPDIALAPSLISSGKGQDSPAVSVRFNASRTVERAMPSRRAISCVETQENLSRIISRA